MKTVIIDDEPLAIDVIKNYCDTISDIEVLNCFTNPVEAMGFINKNSVDLIFIDIEMPLLSGIEFINTLKLKCQFIFTTAYPQFAIDGFELEAADYLIKPISYIRFLKAFNKVNKTTSNQSFTTSPPTFESSNNDDFLFIKSEHESIKVFISDIKYIEGLKDYLKVNLSNGKYILTLSNFKNMMGKLPEKSFIRVHNSYIVNLKYITSVQRNRILINESRIPISESYKKSFFERINI
ncbi:DNA-binding response regulator [Flavobacterium arcticum]|uniref:DNA-binding response regulator n=1 Tax=Flavobacterium arcticum TaxID=1784713 RepID=A0A345HF53_9FLAO|nr:DNA-binding response regulator [Flavobacterium arcticum]KAF2513384.1 response regulator transcription factor [Flavobacterium arcticum]